MPFLRILLVEDEFLIALDLEEILQDAGHAVVGIASTAADAFRIARDMSPDLAFVDFDLFDGRSGLHIAKTFAQSGGPLPVFITANPAAGSFEAGAGLIAKPFAPDDVVLAAAYLAEGILKPPPVLLCPDALRLAPATELRFAQPLV